MNKLKFNLEDVLERSKCIQTTSALFGNEKVLMTASDCLTYVFDNVCEAITFIIHRTKEIDYVSNFTNTEVGNIGSRDMYIHFDVDDGGWYNVKSLSSYEYKTTHTTQQKNSDDDINIKELECMLDQRRETFIESFKGKVTLLKHEIDHFHFDRNDKCNNDMKIEKLLNRYFGVNGWKKYFFIVRQLNRISAEVTLNVVLNDAADTTLTIPSENIGKALNALPERRIIK